MKKENFSKYKMEKFLFQKLIEIWLAKIDKNVIKLKQALENMLEMVAGW